MGLFFFSRSWCIILVISLSQSLVVKTNTTAAASSLTTSYSSHPLHRHDSKSLASFFHDYASKTVVRVTTAVNYKIRLPANFTGMQLRFVRFRTPSLRRRGGQFGSFYVPPRVLSAFPMEARRIAIVYENLGNWSNSYYKVPNYTLVAPIIGFSVYDSPAKAPGGLVVGDERISLSVQPGKKPIVIKFKKIDKDLKESPLKCVKFSDDGSYEIESMTVPNRCFATSQGHFSVLFSTISSTTSPLPSKARHKVYLKWWLTGFGGGFAGVVLLVLLSTVVFKIVRDRRLRAMEKQSECGVLFDTFSVGKSKMPSAPMVRTQPVIEHDYVA
ncbi:uncharacterized protein LOC115705906 [Cannabis sativa]|uniref:Uncharacterized protein n=2 Tax=Cannabis sativa TaxID=3483 RepID=A0A7J6F9B4_CANSA|nr:uncharacterized protein LOC115705906 [Cannabis sativa]KAF4367178.1 hypothetical protein F8388_006486 [Cannabis sativa]KAF4393037.1 hypothetical protein G4B88_012032 [Cannabis sativa]